MLRILALILPVLIPSWRFFRAVDPSPRVQWLAEDGAWHELRPRPRRVGPGTMLRRLLWNPWWNDTLFVVSCAERLEQGPDPIALREIARRVPGGGDRQFRIIFLHDDGASVTEEVILVSGPAA